MKILVVDDEPQVVKLIQSVAEHLGCEVMGTTDSRRAVERLEDTKFDGVFLDVRMPDPDGFELTRRARASRLNNNSPIVLFTGRDDIETMREGFKAGATCFLGKPLSPDRITKLVEAMRGAMLRERRRHQRLPYQTGVDCRAGQRHFRSSSTSISENGMVLEISGGLALGDELLIEFAAPGGRGTVKGRVKVTHKDPPDSIGIEFLELSAADRDTIQRYISGSIAR